LFKKVAQRRLPAQQQSQRKIIVDVPQLNFEQVTTQEFSTPIEEFVPYKPPRTAT
jgi:hypothetical protein